MRVSVLLKAGARPDPMADRARLVPLNATYQRAEAPVWNMQIRFPPASSRSVIRKSEARLLFVQLEARFYSPGLNSVLSGELQASDDAVFTGFSETFLLFFFWSSSF